MSFYGEPVPGRPGAFGANPHDPLKASTFDQARDKDIHTSQFRGSTRESIMLSTLE